MNNMAPITTYELLSTVIALIAIVLSAYTLFWQRRLQKESNDLQRATSDLSKKQLEILVREDSARMKARIGMNLVKESRTSFRFVITNIGNVDARNVNVELLLDNPSTSPLIASECKQKLPAPKLAPGSSFTLIAALHLQSPLAYRARLTWMNPDGTADADDTYVSL